MKKRILLAAGAVALAVALPVSLADLIAGPPDGERAAPAPDPAAVRQADDAGPGIDPTTYVGCRSGSSGNRFAITALSHAESDLGRAVELASLWISMAPDFSPKSDCRWECIVHGLNRTSCDPVYAPIVLPCGPEDEGHTCQSFVCEPMWDGERTYCGYPGNVTGHTHVITDGTWTRDDP